MVSQDTLKRGIAPKRTLTDNAWFVGYAPRDNPEIVVAVLVEHGMHGSTAAAPIARDIVKAYYDKKAARDKKQYVVQFRQQDFNGRPLPEGDSKPEPVAGLPVEKRASRDRP